MPARRSTEVSLLAAGDTFFRSRMRAGLASIVLNARPVWRGGCGGKALETLRSRLQGGRGPIMVIFPEGTRSRTGKMAKFKAGVGALVAGTRIPVVPAHISGAFEAWPAGQTGPRRGCLTVQFGPAMTFENLTNHRRDWRTIASQLEAQVRSLGKSNPLRGDQRESKRDERPERQALGTPCL